MSLEISEEILIEYYIKQKMNWRDLEKVLGIGRTKILKELKRYNIKLRSQKYSPQIGSKYGLVKIIEIFFKDEGDQRRRWCVYRCECGNIKETSISELNQGRVVSCGCRARRSGPDNVNWKGYGEISAFFFNGIRKGAIRRNHTFNITIEYAWDLFLKQDRKCILSGVDLIFNRKWTDRYGTASIDRIDSNIGYECNNIQWVHKDINYMKQDFTMDEFKNWCRKVTELENNI